MTKHLSLAEYLCEIRDENLDLPKNSNSERIHAWHLKKERIPAQTAALFRFVFYRTRMNLDLDDLKSPDRRFGKTWWNPSPVSWQSVVQAQRNCAAENDFSSHPRDFARAVRTKADNKGRPIAANAFKRDFLSN